MLAFVATMASIAAVSAQSQINQGFRVSPTSLVSGQDVVIDTAVNECGFVPSKLTDQVVINLVSGTPENNVILTELIRFNETLTEASSHATIHVPCVDAHAAIYMLQSHCANYPSITWFYSDRFPIYKEPCGDEGLPSCDSEIDAPDTAVGQIVDCSAPPTSTTPTEGASTTSAPESSELPPSSNTDGGATNGGGSGSDGTTANPTDGASATSTTTANVSGSTSIPTSGRPTDSVAASVSRSSTAPSSRSSVDLTGAASVVKDISAFAVMMGASVLLLAL